MRASPQSFTCIVRNLRIVKGFPLRPDAALAEQNRARRIQPHNERKNEASGAEVRSSMWRRLQYPRCACRGHTDSAAAPYARHRSDGHPHRDSRPERHSAAGIGGISDIHPCAGTGLQDATHAPPSLEREDASRRDPPAIDCSRAEQKSRAIPIAHIAGIAARRRLLPIPTLHHRRSRPAIGQASASG